MNLVIVESSTKAKIIEKYLNTSSKLNGKFKVIASQGHLRDLSKKNMGINTDSFDCKFDIIPEKKKVITSMKKFIKEANMIYLAADHDREGEGIAWHIKEMFKIPNSKCKRILFNEITKSALEESVNNAGNINLPIVHAYLSRRILDRLVGFMITKLLWKSIDSKVTLTAGRVQSTTLNIIIHKENEVCEFKSTPYWTIKCDFGKQLTDTTLYYNNNLFKLDSALDIRDKFVLLTHSLFTINKVDNIILSEKSPFPFTTSTLQQISYANFHLPLKMTMSLAQDLYEMGAITYMRTDSTFINKSFSENTKDYIDKNYGCQYVRKKTHTMKASKNAQEAHEAIRPTCLEKSYNFKSDRHEKLYILIWRRTVAHFMSDAIHNNINVRVYSDGLSKDYEFIGKEKLLYFNGWLRVYNKESSNLDSVSIIETYKKMVVKPISFTGHNIWTNPPSRYNESSIINKLEKTGIGRPSTYATILNKLFDKQYIERNDIVGIKKNHIDLVMNVSTNTISKKEQIKTIGDENKRLVPTDIGKLVNTFVSDNFQNILNLNFTSSMEDSLDDIATNEKDYKMFLKTFYTHFNKDYIQALSKMELKKDKVVGKDQEEILKETVDVHYIKRVTRYGPVVEKRFMKDGCKKSEYINLQPYLNDVDKEMKDIKSFKDIEILLNLPLKITRNKSENYELLYGRYGFYLKNMGDNKSYRIYKQNIKYILDNDMERLFKNTVKN